MLETADVWELEAEVVVVVLLLLLLLRCVLVLTDEDVWLVVEGVADV